MSAQNCLDRSALNPFDTDGDDVATPAVDWAHAAARGVLAELTGRRGIEHALESVDDDIKFEIVESLSEIIRLAHKAGN